ncbi:MAG: hypothetical protein IH626_13555, partial [Rhodospirillales bacterium]|nr:hypothetical protein [Rhodospirillales bacterium]
LKAILAVEQASLDARVNAEAAADLAGRPRRQADGAAEADVGATADIEVEAE